MRGATLISLLTQLRVELEASTNPAHNVQVRDTQVGRLQRAQEMLWDDYEWPHLLVDRYIVLTAGTRYYDITACKKYNNAGALVSAGDMKIDKVKALHIRDGNLWRPLGVGISDTQYNTYNSDTDERAWPPERWKVAEGEQIEIWPIPNAASDTDNNDGLLRTNGQRNLRTLVADSDTADLDDRLIVLMAAAEILGAEKGRKKQEMFQRRFLQVRGGNTKARVTTMFGVGQPSKPTLRSPPTTYYRVVEE